MLVLNLKCGEMIDITLEDGRRITLVGADREVRSMRIGIDAPKSILIDRHKITQRKASEPA